MSSPRHQDRTFIVLASPEAGDALRALGLDPAPDGPLLRATTAGPEAARAALRPLDVDWSVRAANAPVPRVFVSDMDSSIIGQECIDELADFAGRKAEVAAITRRAMAGELDFHDALRARVRLLAGLETDALARCHAERVRLRPGAVALVSSLRRAGARSALVSGGFEDFVGPVAREAGFESYRTNTLAVQDGVLTGEVHDPILDAAAKVRALEELAAETGAAPAETLAMGDGANDIPMLEAAGFAIAIGGNPLALSAASAAVRRGDLSVAIRFLGLASLTSM